jgi:hypothetical protein
MILEGDADSSCGLFRFAQLSMLTRLGRVGQDSYTRHPRRGLLQKLQALAQQIGEIRPKAHEAAQSRPERNGADRRQPVLRGEV